MQLAIIGLPSSGKTTIFNAATRGSVEVASYSGSSSPNFGVAKVPDSRLVPLTDIYRPSTTTSAEITYIDLPAAPAGLGRTRGISGEYLNHLQVADALVIVARAFEDPTVPDEGDGVDAFRDIDTMLYEMAFADMEILERRLDRIEQNSKGARASEREVLERERTLMSTLNEGLESGIPIRRQTLTPDQRRRTTEFGFLTSKPVIVVINAGEDQMDEREEVQARLDDEVTDDGVLATVLTGSLEMELAQMSPEDEAEFRESLGAGESGLDRMVRLSYQALDQITFFTGNSREVRAWTIRSGDVAQRAAGRVHSDMERGFIRAEVVAYDDLVRCGSHVEARRQGLLRQEGRAYVVQDGDILQILFNV